MKKIFTLVLVAFLALNLSAQKGLNWMKIDNPKDDYLFRYFYKYSDNVYKAIFAIPEVKPFQPIKSQIFVRTYSTEDLTKFDEKGLPSESPYLLSVTGFKDFTVIYGSTDENKNPFLQFHKDNKLVIADAQMNPLLNVSFPVHGKKNKFEGIPTVYKSHDSSNLIVINDEILESESKPFKATPVMHYINIYDKSLNLVWCDSVKFADIFPKDVTINGYQFDFINGKLYLIASCDGNGMKKIKPTLYIVRFDKPQTSKIVTEQIFPNDKYQLDYVVSKTDQLIISGINQPVTGFAKKQLFFIKLDVSSEDSQPLFKTHNVDKVLLSKFPQYKKLLPMYLSKPCNLLPVNDGMIYISEYHEIYTSRNSQTGSTSTTYYVKAISFIKFDLEGNVEWIKMIDKHIHSKSHYEEYFCQTFVSNGKTVVFYYDFLDNIYTERFKGKPTFMMESKFCMAQAVIDNEGNLKKSLVYNIGEGGTRADLTTMRQINDNRFFVTGKGINLKTRGDFAAFVELKE